MATAVILAAVVVCLGPSVLDEYSVNILIRSFLYGSIAVTVDILLGGPFTGAAVNPARAFGPALATSHWQNHGVYWAGPLLGGVLAAVLYDRVFLRDQPPA